MGNVTTISRWDDTSSLYSIEVKNLFGHNIYEVSSPLPGFKEVLLGKDYFTANLLGTMFTNFGVNDNTLKIAADIAMIKIMDAVNQKVDKAVNKLQYTINLSGYKEVYNQLEKLKQKLESLDEKTKKLL